MNTLSTCLSSSSVCSPTQTSSHLCSFPPEDRPPSYLFSRWPLEKWPGFREWMPRASTQPDPVLWCSVNLVSPSEAQGRLWPTDLIQGSRLLPSPFLPLPFSVHPVLRPSQAVCCFAKVLSRIKQDKQRLKPATKPQRQRKVLRFLKDASGFSNLGHMTCNPQGNGTFRSWVLENSAW